MKTNNLLKPLGIISLILFLLIKISTNIYASGIIHSSVSTYPVSAGVDYHLHRLIRSAGMVDIHVIEIDITAQGITLIPSVPSHGSRATTSRLLNNDGAIAGINADFFSMNQSPVTSMGQVITNGKVREASRGEAGYATFFLDQDHNPFIAYIQPEIHLINNNSVNLSIQTFNKFLPSFFSSAFDRTAMYNTAGIDARFPYTVKFVIDNGVITHISYPGETVDVPENGFVIITTEHYASYFTESVLVGHSATLRIQSAVDFDSILTAVSGAGKILENGVLTTYGYVVAPNARHPRSAVGISQDGSTVYLVAVDGRSHSIGATHSELASILQMLGAYTAMHFDGGGSTTMAVRRQNDVYTEVVNRVSDGSQRTVVNALGVHNHAPRGVLNNITIRTYPRGRVFLGDSINVYTLGLDHHLNTVTLPEDAVFTFDTFNFNRLSGNTFMPTSLGTAIFSLHYDEFSHLEEIEVLPLAEITPSVTMLELNTGQSVPIRFIGRSPLGQAATLSQVNVVAVPGELGTFANGHFTVTGTESGYLRASLGPIETFISINVNNQGHVAMPSATPFLNRFARDLPQIGPIESHDITMVGNVSLNNIIAMINNRYADITEEEIDNHQYIAGNLEEYIEGLIAAYEQIRNTALTNFVTNSNLSIFAGTSNADIDMVSHLNIITRQSGYNFRRVGNVAIANLDSRNGGLSNTTAYNWSFVNEVNQAGIQHFIIMLDRTVTSLPTFDRLMFEEAVENIATNNINVFVISTTNATTNSNFIRNGVTYINLGSLFDDQGNVNNNFASLRFRINGADIGFQLEHAFLD